jgi:hypothetical protein
VRENAPLVIPSMILTTALILLVKKGEDLKFVLLLLFPYYSHRSRRQICGSRFLAEVTLKNGTKKYYPRKYYCYKPISDYLSAFAKREEEL